MTKEELEKEAEQYIRNKQKPLTKYDLIAFAEPREKRIERLSKEIDDLENMKATLENRVAELEAQIEKMKAELHHRLISPSRDDSDCLDKIIGLDRLWQFGQEF